MAKFLFFSDLHCHAHSQYSHQLPNGRNSRLQDCLNIIDQARQVAVDRQCSAVILVGDLFHSRTKIDVDVFSATWSAIKDLADAGLHVVLVKGNHDSYTKIGETHSLEAFKPIAHVVDVPQRFEIAGCSFVAEPYTPNVGDLIGRLEASAPADILLLHQALREGSIGAAGLTGHGEIGLNDLQLSKWRYAIAGDFHKKQVLAIGKFRYCGSPLQLTFGEKDEQKEFSLLDTDTWTFEDIPTAAPRFFVFESPEAYAAAQASGAVRPDIDFVRIVYSEKERSAAQEVKEECPRVQIVEQSVEKEALQRIGNDIASNDVLLLTAYCDQKLALHKDLDPERLLAVGIEELWGDAE